MLNEINKMLNNMDEDIFQIKNQNNIVSSGN